MATCTLPCPSFGWYFWYCKLLFCELLQDLLLCSFSYSWRRALKQVLSNKYVSRWLQTSRCLVFELETQYALVSQLNYSSSSLIPFVSFFSSTCTSIKSKESALKIDHSTNFQLNRTKRKNGQILGLSVINLGLNSAQ